MGARVWKVTVMNAFHCKQILNRQTNNKSILVISVSVLSSIVLSLSASANNSANQSAKKDTKYTLSGSAYVGVRHDSNVSVSELDTNTALSDNALQTNGKLQLKLAPTKKWTSTFSVSRADTHYDNLDDFDLGLTTYSVQTDYAFDIAKLGAHYYHAEAHLGGEGFLTYQQQGVSAGKQLGKQAYLRVSADNIDKTFDVAKERDSEANALRSDAFYFFDSSDFIQLALKYQKEDALDNAFDFTSVGADVAYTHPLSMLNKPLSLSFTYTFDSRNYSRASQSDLPREDDRHRVEIKANYEVHKHVKLSFSTEYGDYASTFTGADYEETIAELGVNVHF